MKSHDEWTEGVTVRNTEPIPDSATAPPSRRPSAYQISRPTPTPIFLSP